MPVAMLMEWPGWTEEPYRAVLQELQLDKNPPNGLLFHVAGVVQGGLRILDIWESPEAFRTFSEQRIAPAVKKVGITTQPKVDIYPAYNIYAPGLSTIGVLGASSMP